MRKHVLPSGPASGLASYALSPRTSQEPAEVSEPVRRLGSRSLPPLLALTTRHGSFPFAQLNQLNKDDLIQ